MAGATDTTLAAAIATYMQGVAETLDSRATPLSNLLARAPGKGDSVDLVVNSAGNTSSAAYTEGQSPAAAGYQTYYALTLAKSAFQYRTMYQVTGTAIDTIKNGGGYFDAIAAEAKGALLDHQAYLEDAHIATIEAAVDSGGSYMGQVRATANLASYESAVTPTLAQMQTAYSTLAADPISADMASMQLLAPIEFQMSYLDVGAGVQFYEHNSAQGGTVDAGKYGTSGPNYNGIGFTTVSTMTDTTCLWIPRGSLRLNVWRSMQVDLYAKNDDSFTYAITSVEVPWVWCPRQCGKLT
jgi:hypothetical protein